MRGNVLVTGAAGFIGSHLVKRLCQDGWTVTGIDNLNSYYEPALKKSNLEEIDNPHFIFFNRDIRDAQFIDDLLETRGFEAIIHLAAMPGVRSSIDSPEVYYEVNVKGSLLLLEKLAKILANKRITPPKFIFASTSSVYGNTTRIPFCEEDPCGSPLAPYPATKRSVEIMGYTYHHLYRIPFMAIRFFTVYGPRNRPDMMAYKLAESIYFGKEVVLYNGGHMYRDWTYVGDIVEGVVAAINVNFAYEIVNLGAGRPILLSDFVRLMEAFTGKQANLKSFPAHPTDMVKTFASIEKASNLLKYKPSTSIEEGIKKFLEWFDTCRESWRYGQGC